MRRLLLLCWASVLFASGTTGLGQFAVDQRSDRLVITYSQKPVTEYVFVDAQILRPYFTTLRAPNGLQLTRNHPPLEGVDATDHATMHPGIWMAFGDINGQDFWRNKARIEFQKFVEPPEMKGDRLSFATEFKLLSADGKPLGIQTNRMLLARREAGWLLIWRARFHSDTGDLVFGDQEEMGLGVRLATDLTEKKGGRIINSGGQSTAKATWGQSATWCDYSGTSSSADNRSGGITLMAGPANFRGSWWHNRDYGLMVANPFGAMAMKQGARSQIVAKKGEALELAFGALMHDSGPRSSDREAGYDPAGAYADFVSVLAE